jgi:hypothetical protein
MDLLAHHSRLNIRASSDGGTCEYQLSGQAWWPVELDEWRHHTSEAETQDYNLFDSEKSQESNDMSGHSSHVVVNRP